LYLWPARMVLLDELPSGGVSTIRFVAGQGFDNPGTNPDPMQPCRVDKEKGRLPVRFREGRGTWRDFDSLLPDSSGLAPATIQHAVRVAGGATDRLPESMLVLGLRYEPPNANVDFWRQERFALPRALAGENFVRTEISQFLQAAEEAQKSLWTACRSYARDTLSRGSREPAGKDLSSFVEQMPAIPWYWSSLEARFHEILGEYTLDRDPDDIRCLWLTFVRDALNAAWNQHRAVASTGDAWAIRALVRAEGPIRRKTTELNDEIQKLTPKEEAP
ncbi:MAG: type I-E CRISPR-associated protein Cse1/CasA, partial [Deferrisomatales bacterium]